MASTKRPKGRPASVFLTAQDRANAEAIIRKGWASTRTGAIRIALKRMAEEVAA